jgi:hypothetical protein
MWEGVITNNCANNGVRIIRDDKIILLIRKEILDESDQQSSLTANKISSR